MDRKDVVIYIYFNILHILIYIWKRENHMDEMYIEMCNVCYIYIYIYIWKGDDHMDEMYSVGNRGLGFLFCFCPGQCLSFWSDFWLYLEVN